jgi:hypothetical protein
VAGRSTVTFTVTFTSDMTVVPQFAVKLVGGWARLAAACAPVTAPSVRLAIVGHRGITRGLAAGSLCGWLTYKRGTAAHSPHGLPRPGLLVQGMCGPSSSGMIRTSPASFDAIFDRGTAPDAGTTTPVSVPAPRGAPGKRGAPLSPTVIYPGWG